MKPAKHRIIGLVFAIIAGSSLALAQNQTQTQSATTKKPPRVIYPKKTELDFEGSDIEGELRKPGEFYFEHRQEEKFDSLVKRRKNFHREILRDVVLGK